MRDNVRVQSCCRNGGIGDLIVPYNRMLDGFLVEGPEGVNRVGEFSGNKWT